MRVAVTGASGFLGGYVVQALLKRRGLELVTSSRSALPPALASRVARHERFDLSVTDGAAAFEQLGRPDALVHLAWSGLPNYRSPHHLQDELPRQYRFLSEMVGAGLNSLTCTGTCFEYGMQSGELHEDQATAADNPYGQAKDALHHQLDALRAEHPFALNWCRLFYMYGPGQPETSLFTQFMAAGARGDSSFAMSGGAQLRDFLPVERIAELIVDLAIDAPGSGTVNVCSGAPISVRALVEQWRRERSWSIQLDLGRYPYPDYEPMEFWGSGVKLRRVLGGAA